jgi:amino acid transporter
MQRVMETVDTTPIEIAGPETEIVTDTEYELKFAFELQPWPLISDLEAVLIQWLNKGEEALRDYLLQYGCYPEIRDKDSWWEWEIPYISVKRVWFKYNFIARPAVTGVKLIPAIALIPLAKFVIAAILILAAILIAYLLIKITVYLSKVTPVLSWIVVGFGLIIGFYIVKEIISVVRG